MLLARREERLCHLAHELGGATVLGLDLVKPLTYRHVRETIERLHGELHLVVNNAGASWRGVFADAGWELVDRHMKLNFEAPVRLTAELLPLLRRTAAGRRPWEKPVAVVNVSSTAAWVSRPGAGAYSASKMAFAGWSDALYAEEREHGVHVGLVMPGYIRTEGFPARELLENPATRWMVSTPEAVADAIYEAGPGGKAERFVPRPYRLVAAVRALAPGLVRHAVASGAFTTAVAAGQERAPLPRASSGSQARPAAIERPMLERSVDRVQPMKPSSTDRVQPMKPSSTDRAQRAAASNHDRAPFPFAPGDDAEQPTLAPRGSRWRERPVRVPPSPPRPRPSAWRAQGSD